tara:strand:- start:2283 stop:2912 length:630 start_codon:yes stop_codon:yes gene_type:complete
MEPTDFDNILRDKLAQENDSYANIMEQSKPYLWTAIQQNITARRHNGMWRFAAAALILCLICLSCMLYYVQHQQTRELSNLVAQIDELTNNYSMQFKQLSAKNEELLCLSVTNNKMILDSALEKKQTLPVQYVYVKDTVIINQTKYITQVITTDSIPIHLTQLDTLNEPKQLLPNPLIYPTYKTGVKSKAEPDNIKVKINTLASNQSTF